MKRQIRLFIFLTGLAVAFIACDRPECKNTNPIFDNYSPESNEYKTELAKQLDRIDNSKLTYWFNEYVETNGQEILFFNIQGDGLCAIIVLNVEQWGKLEELRQMKGKTYRGAEFVRLKFDTQQDSTNVRFIYRDFVNIID